MVKTKLTGFSKIFKVLSDDPEIRVGFSNLNLWASTGIHALNYRFSNDYSKAFLYGTLVGIYGESGSGKSLLLAQTAAHEQRDRNAFVVWVDPEGANSDQTEAIKWLGQAGIDTSEDNFQRLWLPTYRKALKVITQFVNQYREAEDPKTLRPLLIVFDSYSQLQTDAMMEQNRGKKDLTGDQGQRAKQLGDFVQRAKGMIEGLPILITGVMHVYMSQEEYGPRHKTTGGMKPLFMAHSAGMMTRTELTNEKVPLHLPHLRVSDIKDDAKKNIGIQAAFDIIKSRSSKPRERVLLDAAYGRGFEKYSGLWELWIDEDLIISPTQGWYEFTRPDGTKPKFRRADFLKYVDELLNMPMPERKPASEQEIKEFEAELLAEAGEEPEATV